MLTNSQKEHLTYTAIGQVFTLVAVGIVGFQFILPGISEINALSDRAQTVIDSYEKTKKSGISSQELGALLRNRPERAELVKIIQSDPTSAEAIIKKPDGVAKEYLDWIREQNTEDDKRILASEKAKLNTIIPTLNPLSANRNIDEESIGLRDYVRFVEESLLKRFNFDSNVTIGMQGVTFGQPGGFIPENLGMFEFRLDFRGTNRDILEFIDYINTSGKPDILSETQTGTTYDSKDLKPMSNPLITMESFSIEDRINELNLGKENRGRATLKFYIRGTSKDDIAYLKENLKLRQEELKKNIEDVIKLCTADSVGCPGSNTKIKNFQTKFQEYMRSIETVKPLVTGNDEIYALTQSVNTLKSLENEFENDIIPKAKK